MKKYLPALVCGFAAGVLNIVPIVKSFSCCFIVPVAAYFALVLYLKSNKDIHTIKAPQAVFLGIFTGLFAALFSTAFDTLILFITRNSDLQNAVREFESVLRNLPQDDVKKDVLDMMYRMANDITNYGFSFLYTASVLVSSIIMDSIFGLIGALIGMRVINNRNNEMSK
ncbi:MAG: DUF4199 family protein [Bacteroidota bacterium]